MTMPYKFTTNNNNCIEKSKKERDSCTMSQNHFNFTNLNISDPRDLICYPIYSTLLDELSPRTHPLDNLLDIAPIAIKNYYLENPPKLTNELQLDTPEPPQLELIASQNQSQSPRTVPSVSEPSFEVNESRQKQNNPLDSSNHLHNHSLHSQNDEEEEQNECVPPPALIFNKEKPKKRNIKQAEELNQDSNNEMIQYYNEIVKNAKKKYKDMSPISNIEGTEKYVEGVTGMPDEIPQEDIDKFTAYSKLNFICKKCNEKFPLVKACTYYNGGLCCVTCSSCIYRETIGLYDYMKDLYFENEKLYKCDRIIHYRPLWQFLKYEKKKKTWKIAKLCIYCRNVKCWEYLSKPTRRRKTMQQLQNEKTKKKSKKCNQQNISSLINPDDSFITSQDDEYNTCCKIEDNNSNYKNIDGYNEDIQPPKKRSKKNRRYKYNDYDFEEEEDDDDDEYTY